MQSQKFSRFCWALSLLGLAACGTADNPYARLEEPPLTQGRLHTVTLASDTHEVEKAVEQAGYTRAALPPNYQQADAVEGTIWGVPEAVAAKAVHFKAGQAGGADVRVLVMPLAARGRQSEAAIDKAFFRNVLGADVPAWPLPGAPSDKVRVQVWGYLVPDIVAASKRLRESGIPVIFDAVAITTSYLGDHKTLAIRAPDGTVVQLVESSAQ